MQMHLPPKPVPDRDTQPFWDAVAARRLEVPRCASCDHWVWQPRPLCPRCHAPDPVWIRVSGSSRVVSWTTLHAPVLPAWQDDIPFTVVLCELADAPGVRMLGQLCDREGGLVRGSPAIGFDDLMGICWREDASGQVLPAWTPASR